MFSPDEFKRAMDKAPGALLAAFDPAMRRHVRGFLQGTLPRSRISGRPGLVNRTGSLRRSFDFIIQNGNSLDGWTLFEFSTSPYARIQEEGGTITPTKGKYLAIPLPAARTAAGVSRGGPRSFNNTFFARSKAGNLLIMQKRGKTVVPLFVLKTSVTIPGRLGFADAHEKDTPNRVAVLAKAVKAALDGLGT